MIGLRALVTLTLALSIGIASAAAASAISPTGPNGPIVDLGYSIYEGTTLANGQNQWLGIRYGAPPLGNNRFRKAQPPDRTSGLQSAKSFRDVCHGQGGMKEEDPNTYGEDCLFMNIWGPSNFTNQSKIPIFFWLSGGAYIRKANPNYNGTGLVASTGNNMIFISINYRVGPFGFLASEQVRANGNLNAGLYDQRTALEWVQDHITKFGGDPNRVVIVGESAGAGSIAMHLITKTSDRESLFAGLFGVSPFFPTQFFPSDLEWQFDHYSSLAGCGNATDKLTCLRQQDGSILQAANQRMSYPSRPEPALTTWTPTIDGDLVPDIPFKLFLEGKFRSVPSVWGVDTDEGTLFAANASTPSEVETFLQNNYPELSDNDTARILTKYQGIPRRLGFAPFFPAAAEAYADLTFTCPGLAISSVMTQAGTPTWNYRYNVPTQQGIDAGTGVYHMAELPLLFGLGNSPLPDPGSRTYPMIPILQGYYTNFVRFLNPNIGNPVPINWPQWTIQSPAISPRRLLFQVNNMTTEALPFTGTQSARCAVWLPGKMQQ
ncbi:hypothetical protein Clacol_001852 [Clathrus columnatus]|uniref:Carboxylic ester hydrolase n=1 Tax=Clathrus columnatus TaxID=1419009 RepID=A0AAV5A4R6_9AGAM|nr:hypothetical protein Clacol_001852 [Clathrus columnatus]